MSRIGKMPIPLPSGVTVKMENGLVQVKGSKGELSTPLLEGMTLTQESEQVVIERASDSRQHRAIHGLMRRLVANMVEGVSSGFDKKLEIQGVGYRAEAKGNVLNLTLGYSHPIAYQLPEGISAKVDGQTAITISGIDRQLVGEVAAGVRKLRPPEPYKGKGIRYAGEQVRRKAGKAAAGSGG
ncbi:MAG: 50S ribosomal protein L6 [Deltaproteobacteria bacterium]